MKYAIAYLEDKLKKEEELLRFYEELVESNKHWIDSNVNVEYNTQRMNMHNEKVSNIRLICKDLKEAILRLNEL